MVSQVFGLRCQLFEKCLSAAIWKRIAKEWPFAKASTERNRKMLKEKKENLEKNQEQNPSFYFPMTNTCLGGGYPTPSTFPYKPEKDNNDDFFIFDNPRFEDTGMEEYEGQGISYPVPMEDVKLIAAAISFMDHKYYKEIKLGLRKLCCSLNHEKYERLSRSPLLWGRFYIADEDVYPHLRYTNNWKKIKRDDCLIFGTGSRIFYLYEDRFEAVFTVNEEDPSVTFAFWTAAYLLGAGVSLEEIHVTVVNNDDSEEEMTAQAWLSLK